MEDLVIVVGRIDQILSNIKGEMKKHGIEPMGHHLTDVPREFPALSMTARAQVEYLEFQVNVLRDLIIENTI